MGNCLGKPSSKSRPASGGGQRLGGGAPQPGAPIGGSNAGRGSNDASTSNIPMARLSAPNGNSNNGRQLANSSSSSLPSGDSDEARRLRAEAAERRAAQNNQRGVTSNGALAAKLQAERQTSDRELLKRDAEANVAARNNSQAGLSWVVDS